MTRRIIIRENRHYPIPGFNIPSFVDVDDTVPTTVCGTFMFTESCIYQFDDEDQYDYNKILGFSIGHHHRTSFRFGWRPNEDLSKIELATYSYVNRERMPSEPVMELETNKWYTFRISYDPQTLMVHYTINNKTITEDVSHLEKISGRGYTTGPYFGGNKRAPHKIVIYKKI